MLHRDFACEVQKTADSCECHSRDDKNGTGSCVDVSTFEKQDISYDRMKTRDVNIVFPVRCLQCCSLIQLIDQCCSKQSTQRATILVLTNAPTTQDWRMKRLSTIEQYKFVGLIKLILRRERIDEYSDRILSSFPCFASMGRAGGAPTLLLQFSRVFGSH